METEIEQEECDVKWNGTGFGVWGSERGLGTGNMKQNEYQKHETHGETGSGTGI